MTERPNQRRGRRPQARQPNKKQGLWHPVPPPGPPAPIQPSPDPAALVTSLGSPPLRGGSSAAEYYVAAVVERAAVLATALAASVQLLAESGDERDS
jgi:hypothetical protein